MRILIVTQYFWPEDFRINDLALGLKDRGHNITVLTGKPNYPDGRFFPGYGLFHPTRDRFNGIDVVRSPLIPRGRKRSWRLALNYLSFPIFASLWGPLFCRGPYDLIFVFEPSPITVGLVSWVMKKFTGAPVFFWVQDIWPESLSATGAVKSPRILSLCDRLVGFIYSDCDRILVPSNGFVPAVERYGVARERILHFPNTAEELYQPVELESDAPERRLMPDGFRVMFAGNIGEAQDFPNLLAAGERLKNFSDIHFVILGDGQKSEWVRGEVRRRGLESTFHLLGRYPVDTMPRFFSLADALLVSLRRDPVFSLTIPSKLQSYLACGKPIITAMDGEGARLVSEVKAGDVAPAGDPDALAGAVLAMYNRTDEQRRAMGDRGRRYFTENFQRDILLDRLERWMQETPNEVHKCGY